MLFWLLISALWRRTAGSLAPLLPCFSLISPPKKSLKRCVLRHLNDVPLTNSFTGNARKKTMACYQIRRRSAQLKQCPGLFISELAIHLRGVARDRFKKKKKKKEARIQSKKCSCCQNCKLLPSHGDFSFLFGVFFDSASQSTTTSSNAGTFITQVITFHMIESLHPGAPYTLYITDFKK